MSDEPVQAPAPPSLQLGDIQVLMAIAGRALVSLTEEEMDAAVSTIKRVRRAISGQASDKGPAP